MGRRGEYRQNLIWTRVLKTGQLAMIACIWIDMHTNADVFQKKLYNLQVMI